MSEVFSTVSATIHADFTNDEILSIRQSLGNAKLEGSADGPYTVSGTWDDIANARQLLLHVKQQTAAATYCGGKYIAKLQYLLLLLVIC